MGRERRNFSQVEKGIADCMRCAAFERFGYWKFPGNVHGNPTSPIWIIGADPRRIKDDLKRELIPAYWMGLSRRNLRDPLERHFGRPLEDFVYLTDAVKCQRPGSAIPREALRTCPTTWLCHELTILKPRAIVALGDDAADALSQCEQELKASGTTVAYLPHPSPANGAAISKTYGLGGWEAYRAHLTRTFEHLKQFLPGRQDARGRP